MSSYGQDSMGSGAGLDTPGYGSSHSIFVRYAARRPGVLITFLLSGLIIGIGYRLLIDPAEEQDLANYLRSGLHGVGITLAVWAVQTGFASTAQSSVGAALRPLLIAGEVVVRSLVMTTVLIIVGVSMQLVIYAELWLRWFTAHWFTTTLPWIVATGLTLSLVMSVITETRRLIGFWRTLRFGLQNLIGP